MHSPTPTPQDMAKLSVSDLRFVQSNPQFHSPEQLQATEQALAVKLAAWRAQNAADVATVDALIRKHTWLDMCVLRYDGHRLTVAGSMDSAYYHHLEINFVDVAHHCGPMNWRSDTTQTVLSLSQDVQALSFGSPDHQVFALRDEDQTTPIWVVAHHLEWNTDTVFYYPRESLQPGERWADWVTRGAEPAVDPQMFDPKPPAVPTPPRPTKRRPKPKPAAS